MLYKDWLNEWLEFYVKISTKPRTYAKYRRQTEKYILPVLGDREMSELTPVELQKFSVLLTEHGLAPCSVNFIVALLKRSLKQGEKFGIVERQYSDVIVRPRMDTSRVTCFTKQEQKLIEMYVFATDEPRLFGIVLSLYTGLRIGELLALTWEDVDLLKGTLTVTKSCHDSWRQNRYFKLFDTPKTASSTREIPLPRQIVVRLKALKRRTKGKFIVAGNTEYGAEVRTYQRTFSKILERLRLRHRGFHALRHTFATRAIEVGMDVKTLAEILGHRDPSITLKRYAHSLYEHKSEMMNKVGRFLESP